MSGLSFAAIDFETANEQRASACSVGLTIVENGVIRDTSSWLIVPPTGLTYFTNTAIHGITAEQVGDEGISWSDSADRLRDLVQSQIVLAHGARFDRSVYQRACEASGVQAADWLWSCTADLSRQRLPGEYPDYALSTLCSALGIELNHHNAGSDSRAAAELGLKIGVLDSLPAATSRTRRSSAKNGRGGSKMTQEQYMEYRERRYTKVSDLPSPAIGSDESYPLFQQAVVITGDLPDMGRDEGIEAVAESGGQPQLNVTKKTTMVAVGDNPGKGKLDKARTYQESGQAIEIISGDELISRMGLAPISAPPAPKASPTKRTGHQKPAAQKKGLISKVKGFFGRSQ